MDSKWNVRILEDARKSWWKILCLIIAGTATYVKLEARVQTNEGRIQKQEAKADTFFEFMFEERANHRTMEETLDRFEAKLDRVNAKLDRMRLQ